MSSGDGSKKVPPPPPRVNTGLTPGTLPPPPRMTGLTMASASSSTAASRPVPNRPPPHSISANLPNLESAPTSSNFEDLASAAAYAASDQLQAAVGALSDAVIGPDVDSYTPSPRNIPTFTSLPPSPEKRSTLPRPPAARPRFQPPPPPPPPRPSSTATSQPTVAALPPPPNVQVPPAQAVPKTIPVHRQHDAELPPFLSKDTFRSKEIRPVAPRQEQLTVLIIPSERAQHVAAKNGLRISDMFQGLYRGGTAALAPFRSVARSLVVQWDALKIDFVEAMEVSSDEEANDRLQRVAALQEKDGNLAQEIALLEDQIDNLLADEPPPADFTAAATRHAQVVKDAYQLTSPLNIPWLARFRQAADDSTDYLSHEQFQCPAIVLAVCTTEETSASVTEALRSLHLQLPVKFRNGHYAPTACRYEALVLHDSVTGPKTFDEAGLRSHLVSTFGAASDVVRINSLAPETAVVLAEEEESDLWGGKGNLGSCMTVADRARVRKYLSQLVTNGVLPALERRISDLNVIVSDRKKGVKNVLKSFWGSRKKEEEESTSGPASPDMPYRFDSVETQVRLLADTLFLMKDYDAAYSMYRLIKDDYKQDKNWVHYASVHEMMALSLYMSDPYGRAKETFASVEAALLSYSRAADEASSEWGEKPGRVKVAGTATRLATRLCLVLVSTRNVCSGRHLEVADLLASTSSNETSLGAAVLLEQSAAHYFMAELHRKYAFHMLMAGHMFRTSEQESHAFRCFTSALYLYRNGRWEDLHNHLRSALAAQLFSMERMAIALQLYVKLVGCRKGGRVSIKSQQKFLNNLLEICSNHRKKALVAADRLAAPARLVGNERDRVRQERLDRIVSVIRFTKSASRVLELPNMKLPTIYDSSVEVVTGEEAAHHRQINVPCFGEAQSGSKEKWEELMISMTAELKAQTINEDSMIIGKVLAKTEDPEIRKVIAIKEKELSDKNILERSKVSGRFTPIASVRALEEPIAVVFEIFNPLDVEADLKGLQLVARMVGDDSVVCTNEDAIKITPLASSSDKDSWTFGGIEEVFELPEFGRVSSGDREGKSWRSCEEMEPIFLVTKANFVLEPEEKKTIRAYVCPMKSGSLEIVGVRCLLGDKVWVQHLFDIKGPLLQNTRFNRANRVRGESLLLKSTVRQRMPCLSIDLLPSEDTPSTEDNPALDSQTRKWTLRISNLGTAGAKSLMLKTNLPWLLIDDGDAGDTETDPTSGCVGPTGTLMSLPCSRESDCLMPGETTDIAVFIRPQGCGNMDFYMLFRYELDAAVGEASTPFRWLKKMFKVPIYPSVLVDASIVPSFSNPSEFLLSLEVANCRTDRPDSLDVTLDSVSIVSRDYDLKPVCEEDESIVVGWQEKAAAHFMIVNKQTSNGGLTPSCCLFTGALSQRPDTDQVSLGFLCLDHANDSFQEAERLHHMALARAAASQGDESGHPRSIAAIRRANTGAFNQAGSTRSGHATSLARLCPVQGSPQSLHLFCSWRDTSGSIGGDFFLRNVAIRLQSYDSDRCPIALSAEYPSYVSKDFMLGPASVPLTVNFRNVLAQEKVAFEFSIETPDSYDMTGPEKYKKELCAGEQLTIPFNASIFSAGIYNLQRVKVTIGEESPLAYVFADQWLIEAKAENE